MYKKNHSCLEYYKKKSHFFAYKIQIKDTTIKIKMDKDFLCLRFWKKILSSDKIFASDSYNGFTIVYNCFKFHLLFEIRYSELNPSFKKQFVQLNVCISNKKIYFIRNGKISSCDNTNLIKFFPIKIETIFSPYFARYYQYKK